MKGEEKIKTESVTLGNVSGMGPVILPQGDATGSGDIPHPVTIPKNKKSKKKRKVIKTFEEFIFKK